MERHDPENALNEVRRRFGRRGRLIGSFAETPTRHSIELSGDLGFDFVVMDNEHGAGRVAETAQIVRARRAQPLCRGGYGGGGRKVVWMPALSTCLVSGQ